MTINKKRKSNPFPSSLASLTIPTNQPVGAPCATLGLVEVKVIYSGNDFFILRHLYVGGWKNCF